MASASSTVDELSDAAYDGDLSAARRLIAHGTDANARPSDVRLVLFVEPQSRSDPIARVCA